MAGQVAVVVCRAVSLHLGGVRVGQSDEGGLLVLDVFKVRHVSRGDGERKLAVGDHVKCLHTMPAVD